MSLGAAHFFQCFVRLPIFQELPAFCFPPSGLQARIDFASLADGGGGKFIVVGEEPGGGVASHGR